MRHRIVPKFGSRWGIVAHSGSGIREPVFVPNAKTVRSITGTHVMWMTTLTGLAWYAPYYRELVRANKRDRMRLTKRSCFSRFRYSDMLNVPDIRIEASGNEQAQGPQCIVSTAGRCFSRVKWTVGA